MKCPECNSIVPDGSTFCNHCGHKFEQENTIKCPNPECGHSIPADSKFCPDCGCKIEQIIIQEENDGYMFDTEYDGYDNHEDIDNGYVEDKEYNCGTYTGDIKDGLPDGKGRMEYHDGGYYDGEWKSGVCNGKGEYGEADINGSVWKTDSGVFENGMLNGYGIRKTVAGEFYTVYKGYFVDNYPQGQGNQEEYEHGVILDKKDGTFSQGLFQQGVSEFYQQGKLSVRKIGVFKGSLLLSGKYESYNPDGSLKFSSNE